MLNPIAEEPELRRFSLLGEEISSKLESQVGDFDRAEDAPEVGDFDRTEDAPEVGDFDRAEDAPEVGDFDRAEDAPESLHESANESCEEANRSEQCKASFDSPYAFKSKVNSVEELRSKLNHTGHRKIKLRNILQSFGSLDDDLSVDESEGAQARLQNSTETT